MKENKYDDPTFFGKYSRMPRSKEGLAAAGLSQLIISGGEPFLREDLPDIVEHAKRACGIASVTVPAYAD